MFPRLNTALSAYLSNPRYRTGASVALTIAAAAGVGAASTAAGAQPWIASLNGMAQAGHATSGPAAKMAGKNVFESVTGAESVSRSPGTQTSNGAKPAQGAPRPTAPVRVADHQQAAKPGSAPGKQPGDIGVLRPLQRHAAPARPSAPARHAAAAPAHPAPRHAVPAPPGAPSKPYTIYDSVSPTQIPSGQQQVAVYGNGSYQASWSSVHGRHRVLWIDTNGSNPGCDVLDVEPGDASPATAAQWAQSRLSQQPNSIAVIYTMRSEWPAVKAAIGSLPSQVQNHVRYWIADPTGVQHLVPGSSATQWYWGSNYDITTALPNFDS